jgi:demethylmenaquinone methyltransferase/2-methoxy-6-polyprenyl-1,4-benzoquinol methylase
MSLIDDVSRYYAERAPFHDESSGYTNPISEKLREPIKQRFREIFRGRNVLEIACGSGYWTSVIGETAESVLGIDNSCSLLQQARKRCSGRPAVRFQLADAYTLEGVPRGFNAAFAHGWWSHMPKKNTESFLTSLHCKLITGALVLFNDQLPYDGFYRERDDEGNTLEQRLLPNGRSFMIVKNFPDEQEIYNALAGFAEDIRYTRLPAEEHWEVVYRSKVPTAGEK